MAKFFESHFLRCEPSELDELDEDELEPEPEPELELELELEDELGKRRERFFRG